MVLSCARPSVMVWPWSATVVPVRVPSDTTSLVGAFRRWRPPAAGCWRCCGGACRWACWARPASRREPRWVTRVPNRSLRMTCTATITNSHSTARKPSRMTVRVSSDIAPASPFGLPVNDGGTAHDDPRAVAERSAGGVLPVHHDAVGGPEILDRRGRSGPDLTVPARDAGVVDPHVGFGAAAQHRRGAGDLRAGAVDLDPGAGTGARRGRADRAAGAGALGLGRLRIAVAAGGATAGRRGGRHGRSACRSGRRVAVATGSRARRGGPGGRGRGSGRLLGGGGGERTAAHPVQTGVEVVRLLQVDLDRAHEGVALLLGVVAHHAGELVAELARVGAEPLEVRRAQLHDEVIGYDRAVAVPDGGVVVALPLERARDLHGLHLGLEHLGEGAVDQTFETLLELLQDSHEAPPPSLPSWVLRCVLLTWYCLLIVSTRR